MNPFKFFRQKKVKKSIQNKTCCLFFLFITKCAFLLNKFFVYLLSQISSKNREIALNKND